MRVSQRILCLTILLTALLGAVLSPASAATYWTESSISGSCYFLNPLSSSWEKIVPLTTYFVPAGEQLWFRFSGDTLMQWMSDLDAITDPYYIADTLDCKLWFDAPYTAVPYAIQTAVPLQWNLGTQYIPGTGGLWEDQFITKSDGLAAGNHVVRWEMADRAIYYGEYRSGADDINRRVKFYINADATPPQSLVVIDDGDVTMSSTSLHARWTVSDPESGIDHYEYMIQDTSHHSIGTGVLSGDQTEVTRSDLGLQVGSIYHFHVKAYNSVGQSVEAESDGIKCIAGNVIFVVKDATGTGSAWNDALGSVADALSVATAGKEIWVAAETYQENIIIQTSGVGLYGGFAGTETTRATVRSLTANPTILDGSLGDGNYNYTTVTATGVDANTVLDGFIIKNGFSYIMEQGAGVHCYNSSIVVSNNLICENGDTFYTYGGGVCCYGGSPTIINNTISGNEAFWGGGIFCCYETTAHISGNLITQNIADSGAGIFSDSQAAADIVNNIIVDNEGIGYGAGGMECWDTAGRIAGNVISNNTGTGLYCGNWMYTAVPSVTNNTIINNTGSGLHADACVPVIANNILCFNQYGLRGNQNVTPEHNCVYGNTDDNYHDMADPTTGDNISVNPLIVGFHLQTGSLCIGAGDNSFVQTGDVDIDGQDRIQPVADPNALVDMGADEWAEQDSGTGFPVSGSELDFFSSIVSYCGN